MSDGVGLHLTERIIPVPRSISPEAQAFLGNPLPELGNFPPIEDKTAWRVLIDRFNAERLRQVEPLRGKLPARATLTQLGSVPVYHAEPHDLSKACAGKAVLDIHGGGFLLLGGPCVEFFAMSEAAALGYPIFAVDYRMPPDHPSPAALDDCMAVYRALLERFPSKKIAVSGASAGGNLAAALALRIRDEKLPFPSSLMLMTPALDLTGSGDSFQTNRDIDTVLRKDLPEFAALYANGQDFSHPYLSPLFGEFSKDFPPTFIQTGTRDLLLSNCARMQRVLRKAGVEVALHLFEAMPHIGFGGMTPEDREMSAERTQFLDDHWR